jgi:hypothetical protein
MAIPGPLADIPGDDGHDVFVLKFAIQWLQSCLVRHVISVRISFRILYGQKIDNPLKWMP